jgi:type IV pilus assembly protein PilA
MKKRTTLKSKFNSAFSLVELLVVIAVIAVIAAIAIPQITNTTDAATVARNQRNAQLIASQWGLSYQAGNTGASNVATAIASLPYTNTQTQMVFAVGGISSNDITAAQTYLTWSNNALVPTTGQ